MELVPLKTVNGEAKAWETIAGMEPTEVCRNAGVSYDAGRKVYTLKSYGVDFELLVQERQIRALDPRGALFLGKLGDLFRLSALWHLTSGLDIAPTGKLLRPVDIKGGQRFSAGTHLLPLGQIAARFGSDKQAFIRHAEAFGAEVCSGFGDACVRLYANPRVPMTLVLWLEDEEEQFPPRVDLFFDSTCDFQITLSDISWSIALMTCLVMLEKI